MKNKIGIFGDSFKSANILFQHIINNKKYGEIKNVYQHRGMAELVDGTEYKCIGSKESACGTRFTDALIQFGLDDYYVKSVIYPSLVPHEDGSDPTIKYFVDDDILDI